jgi:DNA-binding NarL/FixJ family response regulator
MTKTRVLIADDHPLFRDGIKRLITSMPDAELIGEAANGSEAYSMIISQKPDIAILDIELPGKTGLEIAAKIRDERTGTKIIFLTMYNDEQTFNAALDLGVYGYILKENTSTEIIKCIEAVAGDKYYFCPLLSGYFVKRNEGIAELKSRQPHISELTISGRRILKFISQNKTSKEIAGVLHTSQKTVENHRLSITRKLHLQGTHSLLKFALENKEKL